MGVGSPGAIHHVMWWRSPQELAVAYSVSWIEILELGFDASEAKWHRKHFFSLRKAHRTGTPAHYCPDRIQPCRRCEKE